MSKLKDKVLKSLKNSKLLKVTLEDVLQSQENLLKNYSNPVFNKRNKNKILKKYTDLLDISKSLNRYVALKENAYMFDAQEEKENIEDVILKGGISYYKYIWHAENSEKTCAKCKELDGKVFDFYEEIPDRPHPNCKCTVEIVEEDDESFNFQVEKEEQCNCWNEIDILITEMENTLQKINRLSNEVEVAHQDLEKDALRVRHLIQEANSILEVLGKEYRKHLPECNNNIDADYAYMYAKKDKWQVLLNDVIGLLNPVNTFLNTIKIFVLNYFELLYHAYYLKEFEMDKYYHSKANCEATQTMGILGLQYSIFLSDLKESFDQWNNVYAKSHKVTIEEAIADSEKDQVANRLGRERGRKYPYCNCATLMHDLLPESKK